MSEKIKEIAKKIAAQVDGSLSGRQPQPDSAPPAPQPPQQTAQQQPKPDASQKGEPTSAPAAEGGAATQEPTQSDQQAASQGAITDGDLPQEVRDFLKDKSPATVTNFTRAVDIEVQRRLSQIDEKYKPQLAELEQLRTRLEERERFINTIKAEASEEYRSLIQKRDDSKKAVTDIAAKLKIDPSEIAGLYDADPITRAQARVSLRKKYGDESAEVFFEAASPMIQNVINAVGEMHEFMRKHQENAEAVLRESEAKRRMDEARKMAEARRQIEYLTEYAIQTSGVQLANPDIEGVERTPTDKLKSDTSLILDSIATAESEQVRAATVVAISSELAALRERERKLALALQRTSELLKQHGIGFPPATTGGAPPPPPQQQQQSAVSDEFRKIFEKIKKTA